MTYDSVDETYNVQKCTQLSDRVCDTVYDITVSQIFTKFQLNYLSICFWPKLNVVIGLLSVFVAGSESGFSRDPDPNPALLLVRICIRPLAWCGPDIYLLIKAMRACNAGIQTLDASRLSLHVSICEPLHSTAPDRIL